MTTTLSIHHATKITTAGVAHFNCNAITLTVETEGRYGTMPHRVTIYDLPVHIADAIEGFFGNGGVHSSLTEAEIRADERQKVESRINAIING
jgi:hypothetical protein